MNARTRPTAMRIAPATPIAGESFGLIGRIPGGIECDSSSWISVWNGCAGDAPTVERGRMIR